MITINRYNELIRDSCKAEAYVNGTKRGGYYNEGEELFLYCAHGFNSVSVSYVRGLTLIDSREKENEVF